MTVEDRQGDLPLRPRPARQPQEVPLSVILKQPNRLAVLKLQAQASGLTDDQIAREMEIDPGQWARIVAGKAHLPTNKYHRFNQITGLHYILLWDVYDEGFDPDSLRPMESDLERRLAEAEERNRELQNEIEIITRFTRQTGARS